MNYSKIIEFVKEQTEKNGRPPIYPFRNRFEHIMRVYRWAIKLQAKVGGDLEIISLAALFHDVGWEDGRPHGDVSAEIAVEYLVEEGYDDKKIGRVAEIIRIHSDKDMTEPLSIECQVVMDADLLDEVGAISVLWDAMATAEHDNASYKMAYNRIQRYYQINLPKIKRAKTAVARSEYEKRMKLIRMYLDQLEKELY